jgi:hypothetical protein
MGQSNRGDRSREDGRGDTDKGRHDMSKRWTRDDRRALITLLERHSIKEINKEAERLSIARRGPGRSPNNPGNLASVYGYIEFHRQQVGGGGRKIGVSGAADRLKRTLDMHTANCRTSVGRLRSMYYEARTKARKNAELAEAMKRAHEFFQTEQSPHSVQFPLLMIRTNNGWESLIIDRFGLGGKDLRPTITR